MGITFNVRGDSFTPRVYGGLPDHGLKSNNETISVDATALSGSVLDFDTGTVANVGVHYSGINNWPNTRACSILMRVKFGSLTGSLGLFTCGGTTRANAGQLCIYISGTDFKVYMKDGGGSNGINNQTISTHGMSTGVWYDIVVTYTGDNTADGFKAYVDGSLIGSLTSSRSWDSPRRKVYTGFTLIQGENVNNGQCVVDEVVLWDSVIDPTSVTLESGSGSLNGASRTSLVASTATTADTDPGVANVRSGTGYVFNGSSLTGTASIPSADDVRSGTAVDATTGNMTLPPVGDVQNGTQYGTSGTENTGTLALPSVGQVESGVGFGANATEFTGTLSAATPNASDLRDGVTVGAVTGTLTSPAQGDVRSGTQYGANGTQYTGSLSVSGGGNSQKKINNSKHGL